MRCDSLKIIVERKCGTTLQLRSAIPDSRFEKEEEEDLDSIKKQLAELQEKLAKL